MKILAYALTGIIVSVGLFSLVRQIIDMIRDRHYFPRRGDFITAVVIHSAFVLFVILFGAIACVTISKF